jgi:DNA-binding MarR family transcriptional regulator
MTNIESHKSVAIELPTYRVLKTVAEKEFRSPSKQIAALLAKEYPDLWEELSQETQGFDIKVSAPVKTSHANIVPFDADLNERSQFRTWQILICLYKNRSLGALRVAQLASAINYSHVNFSSILHRPRDEGLIAVRPISVGSREVEYKLTDFGTFVAKDLDDNIPVRLTGVILEQYRNSYLRRSA